MKQLKDKNGKPILNDSQIKFWPYRPGSEVWVSSIDHIGYDGYDNAELYLCWNWKRNPGEVEVVNDEAFYLKLNMPANDEVNK